MNRAITITENAKSEKLFETWQMFLIITVISILISFAFQKVIMTREVFYNLYGNQMEEYRIDDYISMMQKFQIWGYIATPLIIWLRIAFVAFLIQLPFMLKYVEIPFKDIFRIVTIAYFVLLASDLIRFLYLYYQPAGQITLNSLTFIPLALTNLLNKNNYSEVAYSFLSKINLFELGWCVVVYLGLVKTKKFENVDYVLIVFCVWVGIAAFAYGLTLFVGTLS